MCGRKEDFASETEAFVCSGCGTEIDASAQENVLREKALRKVRPPAVGLITIGALALLMGFLVIVAVLGELAFPQARHGRALVAHIASREYLIRFLYAVLLPIVGAVMMSGGLRMRKLRKRRLAMAGAIAAVLPTPFIVFSLPFGIWSLIVLTRPSVKAAFARQSSV
jgi:hypothetical protein